MAQTETPRAGLPRWSAGSDAWPGRAGWDEVMADLENIIAIDLQYATINDRPAAGVRGRYAYVLDGKRLFRDTGVEWVELGAVGGVQPTAETFGAAPSEGVSARGARADHRHAMPAHDDAAHAQVKLSALAAPDKAVPMGGQKITGMAKGTAATDGARLDQVAELLATAGTPAAPSVTPTRGASTSAARADHAHQRETLLLEAGAPVPAGTPVGTLIFEKA